MTRAASIASIAQKILMFPTLEERRTGADFREVAVWQVKDALEAAFDAGAAAAPKCAAGLTMTASAELGQSEHGNPEPRLALTFDTLPGAFAAPDLERQCRAAAYRVAGDVEAALACSPLGREFAPVEIARTARARGGLSRGVWTVRLEGTARADNAGAVELLRSIANALNA